VLLVNSILVGVAFGMTTTWLRDVWMRNRAPATSPGAPVPTAAWNSREIGSERAS